MFLTHLHSDHHADLASLYVGAMFGRRTPWEVWGPSGETPALGTAAAIQGLRQVRGGAGDGGLRVCVGRLCMLLLLTLVVCC